MTADRARLPAEWERQRATLLAWPAAGGDWSDCLPAIRDEYTTLIERILAYQPVIVIVQSSEQIDSLPCRDHSNLHPIAIAHDDTWCRDYGPIALIGRSTRQIALDFKFNAWGGKYESEQDDRVNRQLLHHPLLSDFDRVAVDLELEGGAIEPDGDRRILVNWYCLEKRLPESSRVKLRQRLKTDLRLDAVLGIDIPPLPGDDTDGHIDTIARFIGPRHIVYQAHDNREWTRNLAAQLQTLEGPDGAAYELTALPRVDSLESSLPANYANFLWVNGACLVPVYEVDSDSSAIALFSEALPDRDIIPVPARTMITQFGGPHCATMHIPEPVR